ncbi:NAD(P)H-dependent oxidoreductase [Ectobacillus panaciterrae]|uniref:NAD(P)H-dependent oxidoreductase n=1 Tax=Ectobacillus panaciterrae TaxID=363872 RepID=UPI00042897E8|nr:NAD(P)H-dependent oxidoreductase [Ectobacillus panaciterrae]
MKSLIIYAHPNTKSFNAAIKETLVNELTILGHEVRVRDLYEMDFNPILHADDFTQFFQNQIPEDIKNEQNHIEWADTLFFVYPTWWINMPAMLKGYIDRVFSNGFAFRYTEQGAEGLLKGKKAIVIQTTGTPEHILSASNLISPMEIAMDIGTLAFCGIDTIEHRFFTGVPVISNEERQSMLEELKHLVKNRFPAS